MVSIFISQILVMSTPNGGDAGTEANSARDFWYGIWLIPTACWTDFYCFICKAPAILCWNFRMWIQCVVSMGFYDAIKRIIGSGQTIVLRKKCTLGSHLIILNIFLSWYKNIGSSINKISYPLETALQTFSAKFPPDKNANRVENGLYYWVTAICMRYHCIVYQG